MFYSACTLLSTGRPVGHRLRATAINRGAIRRSSPKPTSSTQRTAAAASLFAAKGYSATSTRELADVLGITKGTFYHHFSSKEALLLQICHESLSRITAAATQASDEALTPADRLEALIRQHVLTMLEDQALHKTMLTELRALSAPNYANVVAVRDAYSDIFQDAIRECQQDGTVDQALDGRLLALLLLNMLNWTIFWYSPGGEYTPEQLADAIVSTFLDGCRAAS